MYVSLLYRWTLICGMPINNKIVNSVAWNGYLMVDLFFFLSGFFSCVNYGQRIHDGGVGFIEYCKRKVIKFYPLMIITAIVSTIIQVLGLAIINNAGTDVNVQSLTGVVLSFLGLQTGYFNDGGVYANPPAWYLCILFLCYLIFYGIKKIKNESISNFAIVVWMVFGCAIMLKPLDHFLLFSSNGRGYMGFACGVIFAILYHRRGTRNRHLRVVSSLAVLVFCAYMWVFKQNYIGNMSIIVVLIVTPCILILAVECRLLNFILRLRPLQLLGKISLDIYLWSFPIIVGIKIVLIGIGKTELLSNSVVFLTVSILVVFVSCLSNRFLDKELQNIWRMIPKFFD